MTSTADMKQRANALADVLMQMEDLKVQAKAILDEAKEAGVNVAALRKVAREMTMQSDKLAKKYEAEEQLDMFRGAVGIYAMKGLGDTEKAEHSRRLVDERELEKATEEFDAALGTDIGKNYKATKAAIRRKFAADDAKKHADGSA